MWRAVAITKLKYDVSGIEESEDRGYAPYDGEVPKPGIYNAKVSRATVTTSSNDNQMVEWIFEITDEPYEGCPLWVYTVVTGDEEKDWKFAETIRALGFKDKATFDDEAVTEKQPVCRVRTGTETYEGEKRAKCKRVLPAEGKAAKKTASSSKAKDDDDSGDDDTPF